MKNRHIIKNVLEGSIAAEMGLEPGDEILSIGGNEIEDIFDYRFYCQDDYIEVNVRTKQGEECLLEIEKDIDEDLGIEFENVFMDSYHSCQNKCIFCFIDQMPPGMRESLYFKDDDTRLSFLQGNYVTLTNVSDRDIDRLIRYRLEPINVSFQTMNPELRCKMLNNRFAGDALKKVDKLYEAGITMNGQIVLCKGVNDGEELGFSLEKLLSYHPVVQSVSVVPVGLTKFRDGLYPLEPFNKKDACQVIDMIESYQKKAMKKSGMHFVHASDEWYLLAGRELPEEDRYDGYLQYENGVGMLRSIIDETIDEIRLLKEEGAKPAYEKISIATGCLVYNTLKDLAERVSKEFNGPEVNVYPIRNEFFGERITVSGLLTAEDIVNQLKDKDLGEVLLLPETCIRCDSDVFLDDMTLPEVCDSLQAHIDIVKSNGVDFCRKILGLTI